MPDQGAQLKMTIFAISLLMRRPWRHAATVGCGSYRICACSRESCCVQGRAEATVSSRQAVIFCSTCGARHGLWAFLGGAPTGVQPCWAPGSPLPPPLRTSGSARGAPRGIAADAGPSSAAAKAPARGGDAAAAAGEHWGVTRPLRLPVSLVPVRSIICSL
jgi:hypothetical protein